MLFKICLKVGGVNLDQPSLQTRYLHQLRNLCTRKVTSKGAAESGRSSTGGSSSTDLIVKDWLKHLLSTAQEQK